MASRRLFDAVPFYAGLTLEEIGGRGVRWQEREAAARVPAPGAPAASCPRSRRAAPRPGARELDGYRSVWDAPEVRALAGARVPVPDATEPPAPMPASGELVRDDRVVGYYEPWWIQIIKAIVIFAVGLQLVPVVLIAERKLLGRFQGRYGPNRVGPYGALQPLADILKLLTKEQFRPTTSVGFLFALAPLISILHGRRGVRDHPVRRRPGHLRHDASGCTASTSRSGRCTCSRSARSPSTGSCSAAGPRARSTRSWARCAAPRS